MTRNGPLDTPTAPDSIAEMPRNDTPEIRTRSGLSATAIVVFALVAFPAFFGGLGASFLYLGEGWAVLWLVIALVTLSLWLIGAMALRRARVARLRRNGLRGQAEILSWTETGKYSNRNPEVEFRLRV